MCSGGHNLYYQVIFPASCFPLPYDQSQNRYSILSLAEACDTVLSLLVPNKSFLLIKCPSLHHSISLCLVHEVSCHILGLFSSTSFLLPSPVLHQGYTVLEF